MKTIDTIHRENLQALASEFGGVTAVAAVIGCSSSQYSQWMNGSENSGTGKPRGMRPSSARRIEKACGKPEGWMDRAHTDAQDDSTKLPEQDDSPFIEPVDPIGGQGVRSGVSGNLVAIPRIKLRLRAGVANFETEADLDGDGFMHVDQELLRLMNLNSANLRAVRVRGPSMEPMMFEDDLVIIDLSDRKPINREVYAVNWNGEALIKQLVYRGNQWYLHSLNPDFGPVNARSGECSIVARVVIQPTRALTGRL